MDLSILKKLMQAGAAAGEKEAAQGGENMIAKEALSTAKPFPTVPMTSGIEYPMPDTNQLGVGQLKDIARSYEEQGANSYHPTMQRIQQAINRKMGTGAKLVGDEAGPALAGATMTAGRQAVKYLSPQTLPGAYQDVKNDAIEPSMDPMDFIAPEDAIGAGAKKLPLITKLIRR